MSPDVHSVIGALLPIAPYGRSSLQYPRQVSNRSAASEGESNQWAFRQSGTIPPFKASMKALCVGLPGRSGVFSAEQHAHPLKRR